MPASTVSFKNPNVTKNPNTRPRASRDFAVVPAKTRLTAVKRRKKKHSNAKPLVYIWKRGNRKEGIGKDGRKSYQVACAQICFENIIISIFSENTHILYLYPIPNSLECPCKMHKARCHPRLLHQYLHPTS